MKKWLLLIILTILYMGLESLRADELKVCSLGYSTFGKLACASPLGSESLLEA